MKPHKPKWIAAISPSKRASRAAYNREARATVAAARAKGECCPIAFLLWNECLRVECIHHKNGRLGPLLMDKRYWLLVSRDGHAWIHNNIAKARERGFICENGLWNKTRGILKI